MSYNHTCPVCNSHISPEFIFANTAVCPHCGTSSQFHKKEKSIFKKYSKHGGKLVILGLALATAFVAKDWGSHAPMRLYYSAKNMVGLTNLSDEWHMSKACHELKNYVCEEKSLNRAVRYQPQNPKILGALALSQTKVGKHIQALKNYQKYLALEEGNLEIIHGYAKTLAYTQFTVDAKEQYYKILKTNEERYDIAEELIQMLVKEQNYVEALGVIGHYNIYQPKTRKLWSNLSSEIKAKYDAYLGQYAVNEMQISGMRKYLFAPVAMPGSQETEIFLVDQEADLLTVDLDFIKSHNIEYTELGATHVDSVGGKSVPAIKISFKNLKVGPFKLEDVKAVACSECAFRLGKEVVSKLNPTSNTKDSLGTQYLTLKK